MVVCMTPTPKLRFVERKIETSYQFEWGNTLFKTVRILQQWWLAELPDEVSEWRDVPIEQE
jgi:hypothetical protein